VHGAVPGLHARLPVCVPWGGPVAHARLMPRSQDWPLTKAGRQAQTCGLRLRRHHPEVVLIEAVLTPELEAELTWGDRWARLTLGPPEWWRHFFDGWEGAGDAPR
ncbi:MAG: hypothetical protein ACRD2T_04070, partial [Thermoanaerobaculia bacterium]